MRANNDLKNAIIAYLRDIVGAYIDAKDENIKISGQYYTYDREVLKMDGQNPLLVLEKSDTQDLDRKMLEGIRVGSYDYLLSSSVEIEGGYLYNLIMKYIVAGVSEPSYAL